MLSNLYVHISEVRSESQEVLMHKETSAMALQRHLSVHSEYFIVIQGFRTRFEDNFICEQIWQCDEVLCVYRSYVSILCPMGYII